MLAILVSVALTSIVRSELILPARVNYTIQEEEAPGNKFGIILLDIYLFNRESWEELQEPQFTFVEEPQVQLHLERNSGVLETAERIDRELVCHQSEKCEFIFSIRVQADNIAGVIAIHLTVLDINDHAPVFPMRQIDIEMFENTILGTRYPIPSAVDQDGSEFGNIMYSISESQDLFNIVLNQRSDGSIGLELESRNALDREAISEISLAVTARDWGGLTAMLTIVIHVLDVNDNSPVFTRSQYRASVQENNPPGPILQVIAVDMDAGINGKISYDFAPETIASLRSLFSIEPTGVIVANDSLDYENQAVYQLVVTATDYGSPALTGTAMVIIEVIDSDLAK